MINAEKFKTELLKFWKTQDGIAIDNKTNRPIECTWETCDNCKLNDDEVECEKLLVDWMLSEYKEPVELTQFEYLILKNLRKKWKYIARDADRNLYVYENAPLKDPSFYGRWRSIDDFIRLSNAFGKDCFSFIEWEDEKSWKIQDILENCEVIEE